MGRFVVALASGLVGAALIHIVVLFLVPHYSERDAWSRMAERGGLFEIVDLSSAKPREPALWSADPLLRAVGCRFDLSDGPVQLTAPAGVIFWSLSAFDRKGINVFSINDKTADASVDIVLASPFQAIELRKDRPQELADSIVVEVPSPEGLVVLRAFQPDWTHGAAVETFFAEADCQQI
ncbi:MAG: DUF1254 domain-containing protein [Phyllobacteriaceae bacterium]|nr:DUF1254 domain-containing protein [Phyllobacteriaceae bacterium]